MPVAGIGHTAHNAVVDLDDALDALYAASPEEFVAERKRLAKD
jgi:hypothetical protein